MEPSPSVAASSSTSLRQSSGFRRAFRESTSFGELFDFSSTSLRLFHRGKLFHGGPEIHCLRQLRQCLRHTAKIRRPQGLRQLRRAAPADSLPCGRAARGVFHVRCPGVFSIMSVLQCTRSVAPKCFTCLEYYYLCCAEVFSVHPARPNHAVVIIILA